MDMQSGHAAKNDPEFIGATSKVDRYKWAVDSEPGELRWVHKSLVLFDRTYQRALVDNKVKTIAREFSWPAFGSIICAQRKDGKLFGIDGQHRMAAVARRSDVKEVPCIVFKMTEVAEEARAFVASNTLRKPVSAHAKFAAKAVYGDPVAAKVQALLTPYDRTASGSHNANTVDCIGRLTQLAEKEEVTLEKVWPVLMELTAGRVLRERVLAPVVYLEKHLAGGASLLDKKWRARLLALGVDGITAAAVRSQQAYVRGGDRVWAQGLIAELNRGQRNKLSVVHDDGTETGPVTK